MPTLVEIGSLQVRMYPRDHLPPHFHISTPYGEAIMLIADQTFYRGRLKRRDFETVRQWAIVNKRMLQDEWAGYNE